MSKQKAFVRCCLKSGNASEAYCTAYAAQNMTSKSVNEVSSRLLKNVKVVSRIATLSQPAERKAGLTAERWTQEAAAIGFFDPRGVFNADGTMKPITGYASQLRRRFSTKSPRLRLYEPQKEVDDGGTATVTIPLQGVR
jgi:Terminase small subunit